jgi:acyl dehydratase
MVGWAGARDTDLGDIIPSEAHMPIDYAKLMAMRIPPTEQTYTERDTMLYGLAVGMGTDPMDLRELAFVLEGGLRAVPTMATVLAWNDAWLYETGVDMLKQVHGEHRITLHAPLPTAATVVGQTRIVDVFDKGPGRGAIVIFETAIRDGRTGALLCTSQATSFARADGGFGGPAGSGPRPHPIPERAPDTVCDLPTRLDQALLYRLCGDRNPLHADPDYAARAGFPRPILHGLCAFGFACRAILRTFCDYDPGRLREQVVRFTSPIFPGETLRTELWRDDSVVSYRTRAVERDVVVLDHGQAVLE